MQVLILYAYELMAMDNSKILRVFNFAILLNSQKFDAGEIYVFYSILRWETLKLDGQWLEHMSMTVCSNLSWW